MQPPLVGRDAELVQLDDAIAEARAARGSLTLLTGEPGIGKTSLARAFSERASAAGLAVAWGRAWEAGGAPPYWPWIEVVRALAPLVPETFRDGLSPTSRSVFARLMPELGVTTDVRGLDPATTRFLTSEAVLGFIAAAGHARPLAIVLDDLHAADRPSIELLRFVAARVRDLPIALLGTLREAEARLAPEVADALALLGREARILSLARLRPAEIDRLVESAWLAAGADALAQLKHRVGAASEGNPLFIVEMLRLWRAGGLKVALPDGVLDVLHQRLALLRPDTRRILELAATQGRTFELPLLCLAAGAPAAVVRDALEDALRADIVVERDPDQLSFTHVLIRDTLYRELGAGARARAHLACAEAFEKRSGIDPRARVMGLAHHFIEAAAGGVASAHDKALRYARVAAERAVELNAHEDAVALLQRALALVDVTPPDAGGTGPGSGEGARAEVLLALGLAHMRAEQYVEGKAYCRDAAEIARRQGDAELLARAALAFGVQIRFAMIDRDLVSLLEEALAVAPSDALRARLMARLAAAQQPGPDPQAPIAIAREAIRLARAVGDPATLLEVLASAGSALLYFAEPSERLALGRELLEVATSLGDKVRMARAHARLTFDHLELGEVAPADASIAAYGAIAEELRRPVFTWLVPLFRAMRATLAGSFDAAESAIAEGRDLPGRPEHAAARLTLASQRVALARARGAPDRLAEREMLTELSSFVDTWYQRAARVAFALQYEGGAGSDLVSEVRAIVGAIGQWRDRLSITWVGEACAALGDRDLCAEVYPYILPFAHRNHVWGVGPMVCEGPIAETLGRLALVMGRLDEARTHLDHALARAEEMGATAHAARIRGHLAQLAAPRPSAAVPGGRTTFSLVREGELWTLSHGERLTRLKDSRGLRIIDRLLREPGRDLHVFELLESDGADRGDAGEAMDGKALRAYRARATELKDELAEAEAWADLTRAERLRSELAAIASEVARGYGLGGRARRDASQAERARINVRRRIVDALERVTAELPELGRHLERSLKTGVNCSYRPAPEDPIAFAP